MASSKQKGKHALAGPMDPIQIGHIATSPKKRQKTEVAAMETLPWEVLYSILVYLPQSERCVIPICSNKMRIQYLAHADQEVRFLTKEFTRPIQFGPGVKTTAQRYFFLIKQHKRFLGDLELLDLMPNGQSSYYGRINLRTRALDLVHSLLDQNPVIRAEKMMLVFCSNLLVVAFDQFFKRDSVLAEMSTVCHVLNQLFERLKDSLARQGKGILNGGIAASHGDISSMLVRWYMFFEPQRFEGGVRRLDTGLRIMREALVANPTSPIVHLTYALYLLEFQGALHDGFAELKSALQASSGIYFVCMDRILENLFAWSRTIGTRRTKELLGEALYRHQQLSADELACQQKAEMLSIGYDEKDLNGYLCFGKQMIIDKRNYTLSKLRRMMQTL